MRKHCHIKHLRVYILQALRLVKHSAKVFSWSFWAAIATQDKSPCLIGAHHAFSGSNFIATSWSKGSLLLGAHVRNLTTFARPCNLRGSRCAVAHMCTNAQLAEECLPTRTILKFSSII